MPAAPLRACSCVVCMIAAVQKQDSMARQRLQRHGSRAEMLNAVCECAIAQSEVSAGQACSFDQHAWRRLDSNPK